jgi:hypothetical protein
MEVEATVTTLAVASGAETPPPSATVPAEEAPTGQSPKRSRTVQVLADVALRRAAVIKRLSAVETEERMCGLLTRRHRLNVTVNWRLVCPVKPLVVLRLQVRK